MYHQSWLSRAIPGELELDGKYVIDSCERFKTIENQSSHDCSCLMFLNETIPCNDYVFDKTSSLTIVEKFGLTCSQNEWKLPMVATVHFIGVILGSMWIGFGDL